jgi:hypothetical protein
MNETMTETFEQNLVCGNNNLHILEDKVPMDLICPSFYVVSSTQELHLNRSNLRLHIFVLLTTERYSGSEKPYQLVLLDGICLQRFQVTWCEEPCSISWIILITALPTIS